METKPSYLGLLNAIAVGELGGEALLCAWGSACTDPEVQPVLVLVMLREAEHARSFAKRINELGFSVQDRPDPKLAGRIEMASRSDLSDREKLEQLGFAKEPAAGPDFFARFFDDCTIDIHTGELLGRYISEERDTGRRFRACHAALCEREAVAPRRPKPATKKLATKPATKPVAKRSKPKR